MPRILNLFLCSLLLVFLFWGFSLSPESGETKQKIVKNPDPKKRQAILNTFVRIEAKALGKKTHIYFNLETIDRLARYAELILEKANQKEGNLVYVSQPDVQRLLCFFVTHYVYAAEAHGVPKEAQVYLTFEDKMTRDPKLELEISHVQNIFEKCEQLELNLEPTGLVTFNWDVTDTLNSIVMVSKGEVKAEVPGVFENDPLLSQLYRIETSFQKRKAAKDPFWSQLEDETMNALMEGMKNSMGAGGNINMDELMKALATKAAKAVGKKAAKKIWKERRTLIATLTKDDSNLFAVSPDQKDVAKALTRLVAIPGQQTVSDDSFTKSLKNILGKDAAIKLKVGKDKLYATFTLTFY